MSERYRPDVGQVYRRYRFNVAPFYPLWLSSYEGIAKNHNFEFSGKYNPAFELENQTFVTARDIASVNPFRMIVLMGPLCCGKSLIKGMLKTNGLSTVRDYMTRSSRTIEVDSDEYEFISEEALSRLDEAGDLVYVNEHVYSDKEKPYRSGFPKQPFMDLAIGGRPFFITKTFGGWEKLENFLARSEYRQFLETTVINVFLLPPAPHVLVLRAIQRTLDNFHIPLFGKVDYEVEKRLMAEFDRSIGNPSIVGQSSSLKKVAYLVNDDPNRVISNILSLCLG